MTEAEWLECTDPRQMLGFMHGKASVRKFRLFAVACCRRIESLVLKTQLGYRAVVAAERMADGLQISENLERLQARLYDEGFQWIDGYRQEKINRVLYEAASAALHALQDGQVFLGNSPARFFDSYGLLDVAEAAAWAVAHWQRRNDRDPVKTSFYHRESAEQTWLARDVFGNPFCHIQVDPTWLRWRDRLIVHMAQTIYEDRRFQDLPILADALEEVGCTDREILAHCRGTREHVRGCWVVDLLLDKN
jgi:hypothetical protein